MSQISERVTALEKTVNMQQQQIFNLIEMVKCLRETIKIQTQAIQLIVGNPELNKEACDDKPTPVY